MRSVSLLSCAGNILAISAVLCGCGHKPTQKTAPSAASSAQKLPAGVDSELLGKLAEIGKACKVNSDEGSVTCPQGEQRTLVSEFISNTRPRTKAIATFAYTLKNEPPNQRAVAANILYSAFRSPWGPNLVRGAVSDADASALLAATLSLPKTQARQAIPAAVHASMLSNRADALYAALAKSNELQLSVIAYRYLMTHGRLDAFKKVQELTSDPNSAIALAALESPENMYNWTLPEQESICPWAAGFLSDARPPVNAKAMALVGNCSGQFVDKLLDSGEAAVKSGSLSIAQLAAFRDLCSPARRAQPNGPTEAQCQRNRKLLETLVSSKASGEQARSTALISLAYQWPDEQTLKFAQAQTKNADKSLAEHAKRTVERLTQRLHAAKSTTPGTPQSVAAKPGPLGLRPELARSMPPSAPKPVAAQPAAAPPAAAPPPAPAE
jgi:hypothetical protein